MNPLALQDVDNEMLRDADEYLRKHKILELFEVSCSHFDKSNLIGLDYSTSLQAAWERWNVFGWTSEEPKR